MIFLFNVEKFVLFFKIIDGIVKFNVIFVIKMRFKRELILMMWNNLN